MLSCDDKESLLTGRIVKKKKETYRVEMVRRPASCGGCKMCSLYKDNVTIVPAYSKEAYDIGESVVIRPSKEKPLLAILVMFILPLVFLGLGIAVALLSGWNEGYMALSAICGLMIGFLIVLVLDRLYFSVRYSYSIVGISELSLPIQKANNETRTEENNKNIDG